MDTSPLGVYFRATMAQLFSARRKLPATSYWERAESAAMQRSLQLMVGNS